jgi:hypothetical protein
MPERMARVRPGAPPGKRMPIGTQQTVAQTEMRKVAADDLSCRRAPPWEQIRPCDDPLRGVGSSHGDAWLSKNVLRHARLDVRSDIWPGDAAAR